VVDGGGKSSGQKSESKLIREVPRGCTTFVSTAFVSTALAVSEFVRFDSDPATRLN
jgi:hypothetical protein